MNGFEPRYELSMRTTLTEYAGYDAHLLIGALLRRVLLFVYADAAALVYRPHLQRGLALRLLGQHHAISDRFAWRRMADFRATDVPSATYSDNVIHLGKRAQAVTRPEAAALSRQIRREDPAFSLRQSPFDPLHYAQSLELALQDCMALTPEEHDIVFRSWSGVFSHVLRGAYLKYIEVLANWPDITIQTHQDFVDTWPLSLEAQAPEAHPPSRRQTARGMEFPGATTA